MSKYSNDPPAARRELNSSGMVTNSRTEQPNGMAFDKPEVEQYFTIMQDRHWRDEDGFESRIAEQESGYPEDFSASVRQYELCDRVEHSRFEHRPVTGRGPKPI